MYGSVLDCPVAAPPGTEVFVSLVLGGVMVRLFISIDGLSRMDPF